MPRPINTRLKSFYKYLRKEVALGEKYITEKIFWCERVIKKDYLKNLSQEKDKQRQQTYLLFIK